MKRIGLPYLPDEIRKKTQSKAMTIAQLDHLRAIEAHLDRLLSIAAKRTPGEWDHGYGNALVVHKKTDYSIANTYNAESVAEDCPIIPWEEQVSNSEYIAACAAEAGWMSTKAAITLLLGFKKYGDYRELETFEDVTTCILNQWPLETLKP